MSETLVFTVKYVRFHSEENGFTILSALCDGDLMTSTVKLTMSNPVVESRLRITGSWTTDPKYGRQFSGTSYEEIMPDTKEGILAYLSSGFVKGIGPAMASRIVNVFGSDTLEIIDTNPDALLIVQGVGKKSVEKIKKSWEEGREVRAIMTFLLSSNCTPNLAMKIYKMYGSQSIQKIEENPYCIADEVRGVGFKKADEIARSRGFAPNGLPRCRAGLLFALQKAGENLGHSYMPRLELLEMAMDHSVLDLDSSSLGQVQIALENLIDESQVKLLNDRIYLPLYYNAETSCATSFAAHLNGSKKALSYDLQAIEKSAGLVYDQSQREAIDTAMKNSFVVVTGGPGCGKTTVLRGINEALKKNSLSVLYAAPTGRAAKRMSEAIGCQAMTIHRLLEVDPAAGMHFVHNRDNPLEGDVLILDECSMIDTLLMNSLMQAVPSSMRVIMSGDIDQLSPVGVGCPYRDIIECGKFPVIRLNTVHRQAQGSFIISNAHKINSGLMPVCNTPGTDFFYKGCERENITKTITELVTVSLPRVFGVSPDDIQVLSPVWKFSSGATEINQSIKEVLNPNGEKLDGFPFRLGDYVMQKRNNYDKGVFNGDAGFVTDLNREDQTITVTFDGLEVEYEKSDCDQLMDARCITIHKSQGSEYPVVVMPMTATHTYSLSRNLIYTAVTRAKKAFVFVGETDKKALAMAIKNDKKITRYTSLKDFIEVSSW